jgi:hypothetical protein
MTNRPVPDVVAVRFVPSTVTVAPLTAAPVARAMTVPVMTSARAGCARPGVASERHNNARRRERIWAIVFEPPGGVV